MNLNHLRFTIALLITMVLFGFSSWAQISEGGIPLSFTTNNLAFQFDQKEFAKPDMAQLVLEDQLNAESKFPSPERMAVSVPVNLDLKTAGSWETLADGLLIWRLKITVPGALALGVYYDHFHMPEGSKLFLYNEAKTQVIGAFTSQNNHESGLFATEFIQGETVTLEYTEPAGTIEEAVISISEVAYAYRFIEFSNNGRDQSWPCMINVACSEGDGWGDQIKGIARLLTKIGYNYYWCSGSLINNTSNNRIPYLLTAEHCGTGASTSDLNQWMFYFNYQSATCTGNYGSSGNTVTGCALKAKDPLTTGFDGGDFELVQLNGTPPSSYNVYYNGWNRTNIPADSGVCLHHPNGDIKKISTYLTPMISSTSWNGTPSHWRITWSATEHGRSIMQPGSSGSPIFDQDHYIMGDLSGGYETNSCDTPSPAWYGKVWYGWDQNGNTPATRLKDWLDPTNTGISKQPGLSSQILPPVVDFTSDTTHVNQYTPVQFTDLTTGNPATSWTWSFPGATPDSSNEQNPSVTYNEYGVFDVSLTVENPDGTDTETKTGYMTVDQVLAPEADFIASQVEITEGEMIDFTDFSVNNPIAWTWVFEGGEPITSNDQNPDSVVYSTPGVFDVTLTSANNAGSDTELKENYITVNAGLPPTSDFYADVTEIEVGDTVNFFDLSIGGPTQWTWTFEGATPGGSGQQNPIDIVYPTEGAFNVQLRTKNTFGNNTMLKEDYIAVGNVSVKEMSHNQGAVIYPNPSHGEVRVRLLGGMEAWGHGGMVEVSVINSIGNVIMTINNDLSDRELAIDLGDQPDGLYIIRIMSDDRSVQKKLSLFK
ncbi:MAG: PKD domain-containing protein [Bacteroidales bacterium]|nr:PKD domain-containing protein [Bacteroidales bacterium]